MFEVLILRPCREQSLGLGVFIPQRPLSYLLARQAEGRRRASQVGRHLNAVVLETADAHPHGVPGSGRGPWGETTALPTPMSSLEQRLMLRAEVA
jgi:hypothetical protein